MRRKGQHKGMGPKRSGGSNPHATPDNPAPDGRHLWHLDLDGNWDVQPVTREDLLKHAEKFGTHMIAETAVDLGYDLERLTALIAQLDLVDLEAYKKEHKGASGAGMPKKRSPEARAKKLLNWVEPEEDETADAPSSAEDGDAA